MEKLKLSFYNLSTDILDDIGLPGKRIIFSTRTGTSLLVNEIDYQRLAKGKIEELHSVLKEELIKHEFLVPFIRDEYAYIIQENKKVKEEFFLSMTIQPTANCQLGCHYCGQQHSRHYATDLVMKQYYKRIKSLLQTNRKYKGLSITWYGGEPLMAIRAIKKISEKLLALCKDRDLNYLSDMITNGLSLKPKIFEWLMKECKTTHYQITLDGMAGSHDQRRMTKSGEPTFDIIINNIKKITNLECYKTENCNIDIRVNIDRTNYTSIEPFIHFIKNNHLQRKTSIYFAPVVNFGSGNAGDKYGLTLDFFARKEIEWLFKCYENNINLHKILPNRVYSVCMVENKYDAFGNIYACGEFPYDSEYSKGKHLIGNLFKPESSYNLHATLRDWNEVLDSGKTWCKTCRHLPVCGGGCPKKWHEGTPACPPFKHNFKDKLLLDYYIRKSNT